MMSFAISFLGQEKLILPTSIRGAGVVEEPLNESWIKLISRRDSIEHEKLNFFPP